MNGSMIILANINSVENSFQLEFPEELTVYVDMDRVYRIKKISFNKIFINPYFYSIIPLNCNKWDP